MIGRVVTFEGSPEALGKFEHVMVGECADALKALPGLHALHVMVDREAGKSVTLAIWQDKKSADDAMDAMVPLRHLIIEGGLTQQIDDYTIVV